MGKLKIKKLLKDKKFDKYKDFLNVYKPLVGLSDWKIILGIGEVDKDTLAALDTNLLEQTLTIGLSEEFFKLSKKRQKNVLFHELLHARVSVFRERYREFKDLEEEYMVNDLVRGMELVSVLKFRGEK